MIRILLSACLAAFFLIPSAYAAPATKEQNKGPQINVRVNPEDSKAEQAYDAAVAKLTTAQQDDLKKLDADLAAAMAPKVDLNIYEVQYRQCAAADKGFDSKYKPMMQTFRLRQNEQLAARRGPFMERVRAIDYIDRDLLGHHLAYQDVLMTQMAAGMTAAVGQMDKKGEFCTKLKNELESKYAVAYVAPGARVTVDGEPIRDEVSGRIKECTFGARWNAADGNIISTTYHFDGERVSFSAKIAKSDMTFLPVSDVWANFGSFDTREIAQMGPRNEQMMMGMLRPQTIIPLLAAIRGGDIVMSASTTGVAPYVFAQTKPQPELAETLAGCVGLMAPDALETLHKMGFKATPDPRDKKAMSAPKKELVYNVSPMKQGDNPVACIWQTKPHNEDGAQVIAAILMYGFAGPLSNTAEFWLMGGDAKETRRYSFDDLRVKIKGADGAMIEPAKLPEARFVPGELAKIQLPVGSMPAIVAGIIANGMEIYGSAKAENKIFSYSLPRPETESVNAYNECLGRLGKYMEAHQDEIKAAAAATYRLITPLKGENPGSCVWQLKPYSDSDGSLIAPALTINGFVDEKNPSNSTATFFIQGVKNRESPQPLVFDQLKVRIKNPADGTMIDTSELENVKTIPGSKLFNISLPLGTARILVDGIAKSGLEITARTADSHKVYTHSFDPPEPDAVKSYNECMSRVEKDLMARLQKETKSP